MLDDLWERCDYITLHTPLSDETRNVVGPAAGQDEAWRADHQLRGAA